MQKILLMAALTAITWGVQAQTFHAEPFNALPDSWTDYRWVDFNRDGIYDILEADPYGEGVLHLAQATGFVSSQIDFDDLYFTEKRVAFNDYDGDSDLDILTSRQSSLAILRFDGAGAFTPIETGIAFNSGEYGDIEWLDLDGDLDLDVCHGRRIFLNDGGIYSASRFGLPEIFKKKWADVNGDGLIDIVTGYGYDGYSGSDVAVLFNQGGGNFNGTPLILSESNLQSGTITLLDADNDSDIDVFVIDQYNRGLIFINSFAGSGTVQFSRATIFSNIGVSRALAGDVNSDGRVDLVAMSYDVIRIFTNTSGGGTISFSTATLSLDAPIDTMHNFDLFDKDQDGDLDIQLKGYANGQGLQNLLFINSGLPAGSAPSVPSGLSSVVEKTTSLSWNATPGLLYNMELKRNGAIYKASSTSLSNRVSLPVDFTLLRNGNLTLQGLPEGSYEWRVQALDQSGRGSGFSSINSFDISAPPSSLTVQPLTLEHVKLCWTYNGVGTPKFSIFRASGNQSAIEIAQVTTGITCYEDHTVPKNQEVEYYVVAVNGNIYSAPSNKVQHHSSLFVTTSFGMANPNLIATKCFPGDYDMDGDYDLEFIGYITGNTNYLLKNNAGIFSPAGPMLPTNAYQIPQGEMAGPRDMDNDGDLDMVLITGESYSWQRLTVYINNNGNFVKGFETPDYLGIQQYAVEDLNNDGRQDILFSHTVGNSPGNPVEYLLLYQTPAGGFEDSHIALSENGNFAYFKCADLNSDGFVDIVWVPTENKNAEILVNQGGASFSKKTSILPPAYRMGIADYTGDGIIDVMVHGNEGLNLYFGSGNFVFTEPKVIAVDNMPNQFSFGNADINLDGLSDLILNDDYRPIILINNGNGKFKKSDVNLEPNWGSSVNIIDFENDGDLDIVKLGNNSQHQGLNYFYTNQLSQLNVLNQPPTAPASITAKLEAGKTTFSWNPSTDDKTPVNLLTYNLSIVDSNGKIWLSSLTSDAGTFRRLLGPGNVGLSRSLTLNNLPAGVYKAQVQAVDASFALSSWSSTTEFTIAQGSASLKVDRILLTKVNLSWQNGTFAETSVFVERKTPETAWEVIAELPAGASICVDANLSYNTIYQYRVFESNGQSASAMSNIVEWNTAMWMMAEAEMPNVSGSMDIADYNDDGRIDVVLNGGMIYNGQYENITRATYENTTSGWIRHDIVPASNNHTAQINFTDLNGDFLPDLYLHGYVWDFGYKTETFVNNGNTTFSPLTSIFSDQTLSIQSYYDVDMDNDLDILATNPAIYPSAVDLYRNNGSGEYVRQNTLCSTCSHEVVADFDKDGDEDVIRTSSSGHYLYLNTTTGLAQGFLFEEYETTVAVTDYNSDGWPDVVCLAYGHYNGGKVYKNLGLQGGTTPQFKKLSVDLSSGEPTLLSGDLDHDGQTDLVAVSPSVNVLLGKSGDVFERYEVLQLRVTSHNAGLIDYDHDGDLDILFMGYYILNQSWNESRKGKVLLNQTIVAGKGIGNAVPGAPVNLASTQDSTGVHLSWTAPQDDHTKTEGLTYDVVLVRDGKTITKGAHNPSSGQRIRLAPGRTTGVATFNNLSAGEYSWKVQAVDASLAGSVFSTSKAFVFLPVPPVMNDTIIYRCGRTVTLTAIGNGIEWYKDKALTQLLASGEFHPTESQTVYVTQTINGYRSIPNHVKVTIREKPVAPSLNGLNPILVCEWSTSVYLSAEGKNLRWYDDEMLAGLVSEGNYLEVSSPSDSDYYVTQTIDACQSPALKVEIKKVDIDSRLYYHAGKIWARESEGDSFYWYRNNFFLASTTVPYVPFDGLEASYVVTIQKKGCFEFSEPFITSADNVTAGESGADGSIELFPNPASSNVMASLRDRSSVRICDVHGLIVYEMSGISGDHVIDTSKWAKGIYVVIVDTGKKTTTKRLVISD